MESVAKSLFHVMQSKKVEEVKKRGNELNPGWRKAVKTGVVHNYVSCCSLQCMESVGHVLSESVLLEAEETIELLMCLSDYQSQWRLSLPASLQLLMVLHMLSQSVDS